MDALTALFDLLKKSGLARNHLLGMLHVLIGRRITKADGTLVSAGLGWRDLSSLLKKVRWDPDTVKEIGLNPDDLPPRDRQRYWYTAIARAGVDSDKAREAGDQFADVLKKHGYEIGPAPKGA